MNDLLFIKFYENFKIRFQILNDLDSTKLI